MFHPYGNLAATLEQVCHKIQCACLWHTTQKIRNPSDPFGTLVVVRNVKSLHKPFRRSKKKQDDQLHLSPHSVSLVASGMLVRKPAESEDLEKKCAVSIECKMLSGSNSNFTAGQEKDFADFWPPLLTHGLGPVWASHLVASFGLQRTASFSQPTLLIKLPTLPWDTKPPLSLSPFLAKQSRLVQTILKGAALWCSDRMSHWYLLLGRPRSTCLMVSRTNVNCLYSDWMKWFL